MKTEISAFDQLALAGPILKALDAIGYETPSPIQAATIPLLMNGQDLVGQAQTGTGKTAAFALPALSRIDIKASKPQVLVLAPTRELAIQVAEAFSKYAAFLSKFHVLPVYGGQDYRVQTRALQRGVHVVVGTPGRIMDHIRRGNLQLDELKLLVLDEADEMLRMGFIDDVQWILEQTPASRQTALFSATMPNQIRNIANRYLKDPQQVTIKVKTGTAETIRQRYWTVTPRNKLDALTRILEIEEFDAMIIFVRTRLATTELSDKLEARGYACAPLNGDIQQKTRERTVDQLKKGKLDIIVATDVAARGLDVERISHVLNYDIPYDTEAYIHRIGRTGRAGRSGDAIMFVTPREKRMLQTIERATGKSIDVFNIPTNETINQHRIERFKQRITDAIEQNNIDFYQSLINEYVDEKGIPADKVAAALACQLQGATPLLIPRHARESQQESQPRHKTKENSNRERKESREHKEAPRRQNNKEGIKQSPKEHIKENLKERKKDSTVDAPAAKKPPKSTPDRQTNKPAASAQPEHSKPKANLPPMERYRVEVGTEHGAQAGNIVGAIANEAGIDSQYIGRVSMKDNHSVVELPEGMPKSIYKDLRKIWVCGQKLQISKVDGGNTNNDPAIHDSAKRNKAAKKISSPKSSNKKLDQPKPVGNEHKARKSKPAGGKQDSSDGNKLSLSSTDGGRKKRATRKKQRSRDINKKRRVNAKD